MYISLLSFVAFMSVYGQTTKLHTQYSFISVYVFRPSDAKYIYTLHDVSQSPITGGVFIPHKEESLYTKGSKLSWQSETSLYLMNESQQLLTFSLDNEEAKRDLDMVKTISTIHLSNVSILYHVFIYCDWKPSIAYLSYVWHYLTILKYLLKMLGKF